MNLKSRVLAVAALFAVVVVALDAQQQNEPGFRFKSGVELINVTATVTDAGGRFVSVWGTRAGACLVSTALGQLPAPAPAADAAPAPRLRAVPAVCRACAARSRAFCCRTVGPAVSRPRLARSARAWPRA